MRKTLCLLIVTLACSPLAHAQQKVKMDLQLQSYLRMPHPPGEEVHLYVHGDAGEVGRAVHLVGGAVKMAMPGLVAARVPVDRMHELAAHEAVRSFEFSLDPGRALNDSMRVKNRINEIHQGLAPLPEGYDGEGVLIGIIDSGMDWQHPDFRDEQGRTRVLKYWDQTLPVNSQTPQPYNYGQVWDSTQINAGLMTSVDQPQWFGHGSTVTGTAAGNGLANGRHKGVAPRSDMLIVSARFSGNFRASVADAVKYICDEAEALGRPVVINASLGTYLGSHDGLDASALFIDQLLQARPGRVLVCAAGNSNNFTPYHLRTEVGADTTFTWFLRNNNSGLGYPAVFFEAWADVADFQNVQYAVGADRSSPIRFRGRTPFHTIAENLGTVLVDTLYSLSGNRLGVVQFFAAQRGGQYQLQVLLAQPDSGTYRFRFMTTGSGRFDVWSSTQLSTSNMINSIPTPATFPAIVNYVLPDNDQHMVDSWACSPHVLTVANYYNEVTYINSLGNEITVPGTEGDIAVTSSKGPSRTGLMKPDLAATGDITFSAAPLDWIAQLVSTNDPRLSEGGMHLRNGGTSMASPVVTGAAALYLQRCPNATHTEVIEAIRGTVRSDAFTGAVPNNRWGFGKLDAYAALVRSTQAPITGPQGACTGTEAVFQGPEGMSTYAWSNGATSASTALLPPAAVSLQVERPSGCTAWSDTLQVEAWPVPATPTVNADATLLSTTPTSDALQWNYNGQPIPGADQAEWEAAATGQYTVTVTNAFGCAAESDAVLVLITALEEQATDRMVAWPSPATDVLWVQLPDGGAGQGELWVIDAAARVLRTQRAVAGTQPLDLQGLSSGVYTLMARWGDRRVQVRFVKAQ